MKRYQVKNKQGEIIDFVDHEYLDKKHVKEEAITNLSYDNLDMRTFKEVPLPDGYYESKDSTGENHYIFFNKKVYVIWSDSASYEYPEDLTWDRDIGQLIEEVKELCKAMTLEKLKVLEERVKDAEKVKNEI